MKFLVLALLLVPLCFAAEDFNIDLHDTKTSVWNHFWEEAVGSCHATFALRADWREHVQLAVKELSFKKIRFHGLFDDDMSVVLAKGKYSFLNIDHAFDWLLKTGIRPLVELSFMPELLANRTDKTIFHYKGITSPPRSQTEWGDLIKSFVTHVKERYGADEIANNWMFEVWNEPNIDFWCGTQAQYFELLETSYNAIKSVDERFKVGGPATAQSGWLVETINFAKSKGFVLDFISTHEYPSDPGQPDPKARDNMKQVFSRARSQVGNGTYLIYTEFNSGLDVQHHDDPFAAAFIIKTMMDADGILNAASYWSVSDLFEEGGQDPRPFQQQFGIINVDGIPKPAFRGLQLLKWTGNTRLSVLPSQTVGTVDVLATTNSTHLIILASNYNWVTNPISAQAFSISVSGYTSSHAPNVDMYLIDENNANPAETWRAMNSPVYPTAEQNAKLMTASQMGHSIAQYTRSGNTLTFNLKLGVYSALGLFIPLK